MSHFETFARLLTYYYLHVMSKFAMNINYENLGHVDDKNSLKF